MPDLSVTVAEDPAAVRVVARGELDLATADRLERAVREAEERRLGSVVIDVSLLDFMDSTGLQLILDADVRAARDGHSLVVVVGDGEARRVLELADALPRLEVAEVRSS